MAISTNGVSTNGATPADGPAGEGLHTSNGHTRGSGTLSALRQTPANPHLFRGYGPLVVGIVLFLLMVTLAPSVAPEHVVERPVDAPAEEAP